MAKANKSNVHPDRYKVAGRERQGEDVVAQVQKRKFKELERNEGKTAAARAAAGKPGPAKKK